MGRVTYLHHYLPTLYFAVLMIGHLIDHFVFTARRLNENVKTGVFIACYVVVVGVWWWFRGIAFGMEGPIADHTGLGWRTVRNYSTLQLGSNADVLIFQSWNIY